MFGLTAGIKAWAIAITLAALITGIGLYIHGAERAKAQVIVLTAENQGLHRKNQTAALAVQACKAVNLENQRKAEESARLAAEAVARNRTRDAEANDEVTRIRHEAAQFGNADCPALDDSFRDWMRQ